MIQGRQTGTLMFDEKNGVRVTLDPLGDASYQFIEDNELNKTVNYAIYKDIYDSKQGNYVAGIHLCDTNGYPLQDRHYKISDFTWSGNISYGGGEIIPFL